MFPGLELDTAQLICRTDNFPNDHKLFRCFGKFMSHGTTVLIVLGLIGNVEAV